jgi:hypothetical protein
VAEIVLGDGSVRSCHVRSTGYRSAARVTTGRPARGGPRSARRAAPLQPVSLALGAEASFVGRALDSDRKGLTEVLGAATAHRGSAPVEIFQDCPIFNDGSFDVLRKPETKDQRLIRVHHGQPIRFGPVGDDYPPVVGRPIFQGAIPNCSRTGTNSGIRRPRRSQLAPSRTRVWPLR